MKFGARVCVCETQCKKAFFILFHKREKNILELRKRSTRKKRFLPHPSGLPSLNTHRKKKSRVKSFFTHTHFFKHMNKKIMTIWNFPGTFLFLSVILTLTTRGRIAPILMSLVFTLLNTWKKRKIELRKEGSEHSRF